MGGGNVLVLMVVSVMTIGKRIINYTFDRSERVGKIMMMIMATMMLRNSHTTHRSFEHYEQARPGPGLSSSSSSSFVVR